MRHPVTVWARTNNDNDLPWAKKNAEDDLASHQQKIAKNMLAKKAEQITKLKRYSFWYPCSHSSNWYFGNLKISLRWNEMHEMCII